MIKLILSTLSGIFLMLSSMVVLADDHLDDGHMDDHHPTTVYQWTDKSGNTVFSDMPRKGAKKIEVTNVPTINIPDVPDYTPPLSIDTEPLPRHIESQTKYHSLKLVEPRPETAIWDNPGNFLVRYEAEPKLQTNLRHRLIVSLDGKDRPPILGSRYYFENIDRGAHQLQAKIVDKENTVLIKSGLATIFLQQQSVNYPERK